MAKIATSLTSTIQLNDGHVMPMFGIGTYQMRDAEGAVINAVKAGYRLIDNAEYYHNEVEVGRAIRKCGVDRKDLFIVNKLWDNGAAICKERFRRSLQGLDCGYIDLYLIHSPLGGKNIETYRTMMEFQKQGLIRSIGVSNFGIQHIQGLEAAGLPVPTVNQIELHPWQQKRDIVRYCREKGVAVMGYSPLSKGRQFEDKHLQEIAKRYGKTPAQIMLRWSVQQGFITIPKASRPQRIEENADLFSWSLQQQDMETLNGMPDVSCTWNPCESPWEG